MIKDCWVRRSGKSIYCSSNTFLSPSKRVSSFFGESCTSLLVLDGEETLGHKELVISEAVCCTIDVCQCNI